MTGPASHGESSGLPTQNYTSLHSSSHFPPEHPPLQVSQTGGDNWGPGEAIQKGEGFSEAEVIPSR